MKNSIIQKSADNMRILSVSMVENSKSGHPGGAMGGADFVSLLYSDFLQFDPTDMNWAFRDRFFLDPGHMSPMLYSILRLTGKYTSQEIENFRQWGSPTHGHPERNVDRGIENTSGPLGMGHGMALGAAIAERFYAERFGEWTAHKTFTFISDGGIQEEISQGVGRIAGFLGLSNFVMFYDSNDIQLSHTTDHTSSEDTEAKYRAWGWNVMTVDGNDIAALRTALENSQAETKRPTLIIGKTIMGKGAVTADGSSFERQVSTHGQPLSAAGGAVALTVEALGGDSDNPFAIFEDVQKHFDEVLAQKTQMAAARKAEQKAWEKANPELALELADMLACKTSHLNFKDIETGTNVATRASGGSVLAYLAQALPSMVVSSADLSNSDQTGKFLAHTTEFTADSFTGNFLQAGVAELTMAAIMNGMALHGGIIPACATFFVFSDYMKPAMRIAALQEIPVKYIFTHDSFRVGEDGPTHQPVEQEAQIRLLEKMSNFSGKPSLEVFRPCDSAETVAAWKLAIENSTSPSALILTRQNVPELDALGSSRKDEAFSGVVKGAYTVYKEQSAQLDMVLVANGSEVALLVGVAKELELSGKSVRVVSVPSEGLFRQQSSEYQESIIPQLSVAVFGISAGLPDALLSLVGPLGKVVGREAFGASAPASVLDEKFGYTVPAVLAQINEYEGEFAQKVAAIKAL